MIRAVFWDNDGVLVDTEKLYFQATRELLHQAGVTLTEELFQRISLVEGRSAFDLAGEGVPSRRSTASRRSGTGATRNCSGGASASWTASRRRSRELRGKVVQAIVTSSRRVHFDAMHTRTGLHSSL